MDTVLDSLFDKLGDGGVHIALVEQAQYIGNERVQSVEMCPVREPALVSVRYEWISEVLPTIGLTVINQGG